MPYSLQQFLANLLPAQQTQAIADPEVMKITPGQIIATLVLLSLAGLSIAVGIKWLVKILQHSHPIAAANRGILRVPLPLTICTSVITALLLLLVWLAPGIPQEADIPLPPATAAATEPAAAESNLENNPAGEADQQVSGPDRKQVLQAWQILLSTILMNVFIFAGLGVVLIITAVKSGRYRLDVAHTPVRPAEPTQPENPGLWADLETASPENGGSMVNVLPPALSPDAPQPPAAIPSPPPRFSLLEEFLCAAEITLAAYFPTMLLRLILALLIKWFTGEDAPSNPLLDMISSGAGGWLLIMVIFTGVVVAPVVEELQFRVVLLGGLLQAGLKKMAVIGAAVSFSLMHGFPDGLALLPLAFALGYAYTRRQSYLTAIFVHFMFNAINLGITVAAMGK
jgi:membrane protease YdiL (CAAX protease family)